MTWMLTANRTRARLLAEEADGLTVVETLAHEEGRKRDRDVQSDRPGRSFDRTGHGRHAMESPTSPHEQSAIEFAQEVADVLQKARLEGRFNHIVLVAEPHFLGLLRAALDPATERLVKKTVAKDLEHLKPSELRQYLSR